MPATINGEPDVLSGLLVRYLLELPEPLVPVSHYKPLLSLLTSSKKFKNGKDRGGAAAVKQVVDGSDFSKVHFHALRRVCGLMRTMLNSWWSDSGETARVLDIMALNIMRPDNLNRSVTSQKDISSIKEAVANLIIHSNSIFVTSGTAIDLNARRISMIRKGERASRLQLMVDAENGNNENGSARGENTSTRARRLSNVNLADTPRHDIELRHEFKAYRESTNAEIAELREMIVSLQTEIKTLRHQFLADSYASANGSEYDDCESPPSSPVTKKTESNSRLTTTSVPVPAPGSSNPSTSALATTALDSPSPKQKSSHRLLRQESSTKSSMDSSKSSDIPSKRDSKKDLKSEDKEESHKKHKHKKDK